MGKKIAILIGVSDYDYETSLPPCENDLALMTAIIKSTGKYDEWLVVEKSPKGSDAKNNIASFIRKYQNQNIEEVFFYYTGHGTRYSDDFLFIFSDYIKNKVEQTSLRNSELDFMLKSLSPKLAVKVVDACQAGTEYIKSDEDLEDIFNKSSEACFNNTYFLFSSSSSEASIAESEYSLFTKSFANAIVDFTGQSVRYRDLMAYISDDTSVTSRQTPLFIQQANNTEVFCEMSEDLIKAIRKGRDEKEKEDNPSPDDASKVKLRFENKLIEIIKSKASEYCTEEEAQQSLSTLIQSVTNFKFEEVLEKLYVINVEQKNSYNGITGIKNIGTWLSKENEPYFIKLNYTVEEYEGKERVEYEASSSIFSSSYIIARSFGSPKKIEYETVTKYRDVIDGFQLTASAPCNAVEISLVPKEQNLPWYKVFIVFVFSKSKLAIFYKYEKEKEISWDHRQTLNHQQWKTMICTLKDKGGIQKSTSTIMTNIKDGLTSELSSIFLES